MEAQARPTLPDTMPTAPFADDDEAPTAPDVFFPPWQGGGRRPPCPTRSRHRWNSHRSRGRLSPRSGFGVRTTLRPRLPLPLLPKEGPGHWSMLPPFRPKKRRGLGGIPSYALAQHPGGDERYCVVGELQNNPRTSHRRHKQSKGMPRCHPGFLGQGTRRWRSESLSWHQAPTIDLNTTPVTSLLGASPEPRK
jgi:hypothetical protein